jgi:hypothetical protein
VHIKYKHFTVIPKCLSFISFVKDTAAVVAAETQLVPGTDEGHLVVVGQIRCSQMATL